MNPDENLVPTIKDLDAARELIEENQVLNSNPRVQMLLENDFVTEDGRQLDPGNFLAAMLAFIENNKDANEVAIGKALDENMATFARPTR